MPLEGAASGTASPRGRGGGLGGGFRGQGGVSDGGAGRGQGSGGQGGPPAESPVKCYNYGQFGHVKRFCTKPPAQFPAQGGVKGAVVTPLDHDATSSAAWQVFLTRFKSCCNTVSTDCESDSRGATVMATRRVPRLPITIDGVTLPCLSLLDSGASLSVLVPADLLPDIFKD